MSLVERARELRPILVEAAQSLDDETALQAKEFYNKWSSYIGQTVETGLKFVYNDELWRVRQDHTVQAQYPPSTDTASLYERIDETHSGTKEDPIPYDMNLAVFKDKYYTENDILYRCTRDSGNPLYATCASLVGIYFELV